MTAIPRREFLWQALSACGAAALVPAPTAGAVQAGAVDRAAATSAGYLGGQGGAARAVGEAYLRQLGRETTRESIVAAARGALRIIDRSRTDADAIRALVRAVREDFERGRSVQIEGWILSRTEAELCALTLFDA
ncbi:MAG: hypothetical protein AB7U83_04545 [Vicinamibacterales bacterium]